MSSMNETERKPSPNNESLQDGSPTLALEPRSPTEAAPPTELAKQNATLYLVFCHASIIMGSSLTMGYNLTVINAPYAAMSEFLNESSVRQGKVLTEDELSVQYSLVVTLYLIGAFFGSIWVPNALSAALGKRKALLVTSGIGAIGAAISFITPWTDSCIPLMIGRFIVGIQSGMSMIIGPDLIAEQAPARLRGACGSLMTMGSPIGINITSLLGLSFILGQRGLWQYLFLVLLGIYIIHAICLLFVTESPIYLLAVEKEQESLNALMRLRGGTELEVQAEMREIKEILEEERTAETISLSEIFKCRQLWWPMIIVVNMGIVCDLTGLTAAFFYVTKVLENGGLDGDMAAVANLCLSFVTTLGVAVSVPTIDRFGRRLFMIFPLYMLCVANAMLVVAVMYNIFELGIAGFAVFLFFYGTGPGILPLYMTAEMFPQSARSIAYSVGMFTAWCASILISFIFPVMELNIQQYCFLPFVAIAFGEATFFLFYLPETSSRLFDFDRDRFAPGRSLLQLKTPPKRSTIAQEEANKNDGTSSL